MRKRLLKQVFALIVIVFICYFGSVYYYESYFDPYREQVTNMKEREPLTKMLTKKEAKEDIQYLYTQLEKYHPAWVDGSNHLVKEVKEQYQTELESFGEEVSVLEVWRASARICAKLKDGHTNLLTNTSDSKTINPSNEISKYGWPIQINGQNTMEIYQRFLTQCSYELEPFAKYLFENFVLTSEEFLQYCGVDTNGEVSYTYQTKHKEKTKKYIFVQEAKQEENETTSDVVSYEIEREKNVGVLIVKECNADEIYQETLKEFFYEINKNGIENIVLDLRENGGGESKVIDYFMEYIDVKEYKGIYCDVRRGWAFQKGKAQVYKNKRNKQPFDGRIFVLTSGYTFSAATDWAMTIKDNGLGVLVGETSGNLPDAYGDIITFQMKNSKLLFHVSYKKWHRIDSSKQGEPLTPDYETDEEEALNYVYQLIQ